MARHCDYCGESEKSSPVRDTFAVLNQTIAGTGGRQGKSSTDKVDRFPLGEACVPCGKRISLAIGNLVGSIKVRETALPEIPAPEPEAEAEKSSEGPQETQEDLPLGGTDEDSGPQTDASEAEGVAPAAVPIEEQVIGTDNGGAVHARRRGRPASA